MTQLPSTHNIHKRAHLLATPASLLGVAVLLAGCAVNQPGGVTTVTQPITPAAHALGKVYGGQQPVSGATIQLYTVGTTGLKSASTALITATITTSDGTGTMDSNANAGNAFNTFPLGSFTIPTGDYSCTGATPGTQVYITASGGNPGNGTNTNLTLVAALGSCASLLANAATTTININEITTIAAAYALAPFATDITHIGASGSSPTGLVNAFANAASLANTSYGTPGGATLPSGTTAPVTELNTLANILAGCVNTAGSPASACTSLFSATGATDTFDAGLAIARNPGASTITNLYILSNSTAPFQPAFATQPNDFTVALSYNAGSTLSTPYAIAIDASGDAWITNESGTAVTELSPTGSVLASPTATGLFGAEGIAIDRSGSVWVANTAGNSVVKFGLTSGSVTSTNSYTTGGINAPSAIALDSQGNAFIANFNGNSVTELNTSGVAQNSSPFTGSSNITVPSGIAIDPSGNVFVTSGAGTAVKLTHTGTYSATFTDNALQGPVSLALDPSADLFLTGATTGTTVAGAVSEFNSSGVSALTTPLTSGVALPAGVASDGTSFWVANSTTSGSLAKLTYGSASSTSPSTGFGSLNTPVGVAVDASGSVWTANSGSNTVTQFIGLAAPVTTPIAASTSVGP